MKIEIVNPLTRPDWDDLVLKAEGHTFFHSSNWARTLHESYGFAPTYFCAFEGKELRGVIPVMDIRSFLSGCRGVGLPFSDYCPFLGTAETLRLLLDGVLAYGREAGWKHVELRCDHPILKEQESCRFHYVHTIDLRPGPDMLYRNLRDSTKRNIKKAAKEGVTVTRSADRSAVADFCRLNSITRRQHGLPPQPSTFFENFHKNVMASGMGQVYLAHLRGACIAGAVYVRFGDEVVYKYGASDPSFQQVRGNNLVMWEAMRDYSLEGGISFSFGRTEPENDGLRQFKNGWGGVEETIRYHRYSFPRNSFDTDGGNHSPGYTKILARLPIPVLETIGKYLYRHVG